MVQPFRDINVAGCIDRNAEWPVELGRGAWTAVTAEAGLAGSRDRGQYSGGGGNLSRSLMKIAGLRDDDL